MTSERPSGAVHQDRTPLEVPRDLLIAPGFGARRLQQAYLAAWIRHVDATLTGPQYAVLIAVHEYPESDQTSLAEVVALDTSTMADVCRRLERRGLIARTESRHDARRKLLSLKPAGSEVLYEIRRRAHQLDRALLDIRLDPAQGVAGWLNGLAAHWERVATGD